MCIRDRLYILHNEKKQLWNQILINDPNAVYFVNLQVNVNAGDTLIFGTNQISNPDCDGVYLAPVIRYIIRKDETNESTNRCF